MNGSDSDVTIVMITHNRLAEVLRSTRASQSAAGTPRNLGGGQRVRRWHRRRGRQAISASQATWHWPRTWEQRDGRSGLLMPRRLTSPSAMTTHGGRLDPWAAPLHLFDVHPQVAVMTGRILVGPEDREDPICGELEQSPLPDEPDLPGYPLLGFLAGASVIRRSAFLEVGGFESRFFIGGEEELLALDLATQGWSLRYVPELVVHHHPSPNRDAASRRWHLLRNALWSAWLRRPLHSALRETVRLIRTSPRDRTALLGFSHALAGLPWVLRQRRVVPPWVEHRLSLLDSRRVS